LTGGQRPLYSAGFATPAARRASEGPCGGIGRRARLKIEFRKECWFDSGQGHHPTIRPYPRTFIFINKHGAKVVFSATPLFTRISWYPGIFMVSFLYSFDAKQKLLAIGQYPPISLADVRIERDSAKTLLVEGIDPSV
jgi:hypothetical protein